MVEPQTVFPEQKIELLERRHEYGSVYTYIWKPLTPVAFSAGQYVHVRLDGMDPGVKAVREFSFASAPHEDEIWFGIDARSESPYQKRLQELQIGEAVTLFKIKGHMTWPPDELDVVMIAGGIGVTPFRSMLRDSLYRDLPRTATLIHASNSSFLYEHDFETLPVDYKRVEREQAFETLTECLSLHPSARYQIAGSPSFVKTIIEILSKAGIERIESDEFKGLVDSAPLD